jgi:hypothetical protein
MRDLIRQIAVILATIGVIVINGLASALPLNGQSTGEISDQFQVYFVPAGYVFAIWGLIYLALIGYSIYQALPAQRQNPRLRRIGWLYVLSCVANVAWLFLWHYEIFELTIVAMVTLLVLLIAIYLILGIGRGRTSTGETWLVRVPFSIYLGWITVATIANVTSLLDDLNWGAWGISPEIWAGIMLLAAGLITLAVNITRGDIAYAAVIVWALIGIAIKHSGAPVVPLAAWLMVVVVLLTLLVGVLLRQKPDEAWDTGLPKEGIRDRW